MSLRLNMQFGNICKIFLFRAESRYSEEMKTSLHVCGQGLGFARDRDIHTNVS